MLSPHLSSLLLHAFLACTINSAACFPHIRFSSCRMLSSFPLVACCSHFCIPPAACFSCILCPSCCMLLSLSASAPWPCLHVHEPRRMHACITHLLYMRNAHLHACVTHLLHACNSHLPFFEVQQSKDCRLPGSIHLHEGIQVPTCCMRVTAILMCMPLPKLSRPP